MSEQVITQAASAQQSVTGTAIAVINGTIAEFDRVEAGIAALDQRYGGVAFPVDGAKGMQEAKDARLAIRTPRYAVENARKSAKAPLLELGREIDTRAKGITERLLKIEGPIDDQIKAEEDRREKEREARRVAEAERVRRHESEIGEIAAVVMAAIGKTAAEIEVMRTELAGKVLEGFEEYQPQADRRRAEAVEKLGEMLADAKRKEEEQRKLAADREALARERAEQARAAAAAAERAAAERAAAEAELAAARRAAEEKLAAERAEFERQQQAARAAADAERLAREAQARREAEAAAQVERERVAAAQAAEAEAARLAKIDADLIAAERAAADAALEKVRSAAPLLLDALQELVTDAVVAQWNMRDAAKTDPRWAGCSEALQPRIDAARAAIAAATN
jgi:colicin import membrane protein